MTDAALLLYAACAVFAVFGYGCGFIAGHRAGRRIGFRAGDRHGRYWQERGR